MNVQEKQVGIAALKAAIARVKCHSVKIGEISLDESGGYPDGDDDFWDQYDEYPDYEDVNYPDDGN